MTQRIKLNKGARALVVVAHPDDETIWMGGTILKNADINWTIFSLCRASDCDRAPKFKRACNYYKAKSIITDLDDEGKLNNEKAITIAKRLLTQKLKAKKFDYLFTHGENGEYGHPVHLQVNTAINNLLDKEALKAKIIFYFNYKKHKTKKDKLIAKKYSNLIIKLNKKEFIEKKGVVSKMYGYAPDGIDVGYCVNPESFLIKK